MGEQKRYALVSGATGGMGRYICKSLLERGLTLYLPCRSREKEEELRHFLERESPLYKRDLVVCVQADFESFSSVLALCERVMEECGEIELLMNNAAIIAPEFKLTPDGYERSLQVNYLVPRYMTELLLPHITRQVINTVSCSTKVVSFNRFCKEIAEAEIFDIVEGRFNYNIEEHRKHFGHLKDYSRSKLLLDDFTHRLRERTLGGLYVDGADPGIVDTNIITQHRWYDSLADVLFRPLILSPERGAARITKYLK